MAPCSQQLLVSEDGDAFRGTPAVSRTEKKTCYSWHVGHRIPLQGGAWAVPRVCFPVPHILLSASISGAVFLLGGIVISFSIL